MMFNDPTYLAGFRAGIEAATSYIEGRASMAAEMSRHLDAEALQAASKSLAALAQGTPTPLRSRPPPPPPPPGPYKG